MIFKTGIAKLSKVPASFRVINPHSPRQYFTTCLIYISESTRPRPICIIKLKLSCKFPLKPLLSDRPIAQCEVTEEVMLNDRPILLILTHDQ